MKTYEEIKRGYSEKDFIKGKTYVLNFMDQEYAYIKVEEIKPSFMAGEMAFSKTQEFSTDNSISQFHLWYKDIVDVREASKMEDFFFLHHFNAVNFKKIALRRIKELQERELSAETALTLVDLKASISF